MGCIKKVALSEPLVDAVEPGQIISTSCKILDFDLYDVTTEDLAFAHTYSLHLTRTDTIHGLVGWFEARFTQMQEPIKLTTSPYCRLTHWKHTVFYLSQPIAAKRGGVLQGSIAVRKSTANFRDLDIKLSYHYLDTDSKIDYIQMYKLR